MRIEKDGVNITSSLLLRIIKHATEDSHDGNMETITAALRALRDQGLVRPLIYALQLNDEILLDVSILVSTLLHLDRTVKLNDLNIILEAQIDSDSKDNIDDSSDRDSTDSSKESNSNILRAEAS